MNSDSVSILEAIEQQRQQQHRKQKQQEHRNVVTTRCTDVVVNDDDGPIENPETAIQKLKHLPFDLKLNINGEQKIESGWTTTPMIYFCYNSYRLPMIRFLKLHGASCTNRDSVGWFPMYAAAWNGQLEKCEWLYKYGGDAKYDVNKEFVDYGCFTPLSASMYNEYVLQAQWLILHGGALRLSERSVDQLQYQCRHNEAGHIIMSWTRMNIVFHDTTFFLFLCGTSTRTHTSTDTNMTRTTMDLHSDLPLLNGQPGVMELIGDYAGLIYGTKMRLLKEFLVLVEL